MTNPTLGTLAILGALGLAGLYPCHRLALALEARGYIYYLRSKSRGGASRMLFPLREAIDPASKHVMEVEFERRVVSREDVPGSKTPPGDEDGA